ncbi:type II secretion system minor pseudopilin GspJ [Thaumasiovibrio subtropicus]|uniref:type II secretion system minor pseudopilin GspJ n=1 Tax=Thaumasiovibrio subtropicus TaxID=1891207 RepID=UPI000B35DCD5|nr:type II secretion system minor pseudopilin GspJ [Thaumasiovibrio subtropicus]
MKRQIGFTLIEVLVAIAVMAMLSLMVFQTLSGVQKSNQISQERGERLEEMQRALVMMDNDFRQIVARKVRMPGDEKPSNELILAGEYLIDSSSNGIMFTRGGWQNPNAMFSRGEVVRVGYRIIEDTLERVYFRYPDSVVGEEPLVTPLLQQVTEVKFAFYQGDDWSANLSEGGSLPEGVRVTLTLEDYGEIERIYVLPKSVVQTEEPTT